MRVHLVLSDKVRYSLLMNKSVFLVFLFWVFSSSAMGQSNQGGLPAIISFLLDENQAPTATITSAPSSIDEGGAFVTSGTVVDPEDGNLTPNWTASGDCAISGPNGGSSVNVQTNTNASLSDQNCTVSLSGTDSEGEADMTSANVLVNNTNVANSAPTINTSKSAPDPFGIIALSINVSDDTKITSLIVKINGVEQINTNPGTATTSLSIDGLANDTYEIIASDGIAPAVTENGVF